MNDAPWDLCVHVPGEPIPEPRPRADRRSGRVYVPDRGQRVWKHQIRAETKLALVRDAETRPDMAGVVPLSGCAFCVLLVFSMSRPKSHFGTGRNSDKLRTTAPRAHCGRPDVDNLAKAALDALGAFDDLPPLVWCDDSQVVSLRARKRYAEPGGFPAGLFMVLSTSAGYTL